MTEHNEHLAAFEEGGRERSESVLAWVEADAGGREGVAIVTDRRLCFTAGGQTVRSAPVTGPVLRYNPSVDGDTVTARFETDVGTIDFTVTGEEERRHLGNLLGNLAELREAQAVLQEGGVDPLFVSPAPKPGEEGVSASYQLIRLKTMVEQGLLGEIEFAIHRAQMVDGFRREAAGG